MLEAAGVISPTVCNASGTAHVQTSMIYATSSPNENKSIYRLIVADSRIRSTPCGSQQIVLNKLISWLNTFLHCFPFRNEYI